MEGTGLTNFNSYPAMDCCNRPIYQARTECLWRSGGACVTPPICYRLRTLMSTAFNLSYHISQSSFFCQEPPPSCFT